MIQVSSDIVLVMLCWIIAYIWQSLSLVIIYMIEVVAGWWQALVSECYVLWLVSNGFSYWIFGFIVEKVATAAFGRQRF